MAFHGAGLEDAKLGLLTETVLASALTWCIFLGIATIPGNRRARALLGTDQFIVGLAVPVDPELDRIRGPKDGLVTVIEP